MVKMRLLFTRGSFLGGTTWRLAQLFELIRA